MSDRERRIKRICIDLNRILGGKPVQLNSWMRFAMDNRYIRINFTYITDLLMTSDEQEIIWIDTKEMKEVTDTEMISLLDMICNSGI